MSAINDLVAEALNEPVDIPRGLFRARNPENKVKPADLAFKAVYGRFPVGEVQGNDHSREADLPSGVFDRLHSIPGVSITTLCEGHSRDRIAYVVFVPSVTKEQQVNKIVERLKSCSDTYAIYDRGNQGRFRVCVASKLWFQKDGNNDRWEEWWSQIPNCIESAVK